MTKPKLGFTPVRIVYSEPWRVTPTKRPYLAKWDGEPKRPPTKGEFYLSGAAGYVVAYESPADLSTAYFIAVPVAGGTVL